MRLADFQRRMELQRAQTAAKLLQLWSVVWLQRLVRRRMAERSRLAAEVALVREPGAGAGLSCRRRRRMAPRSTWLQRAMQQQFVPGWWRLRSGRWARELSEVPPAKAVAWLGALTTSPAARPEAAAVVAAAAGGARVPSAAEGKRRVDFGAPVPPSKRGWATSGGAGL
jgi:hypothetical protein